MITKFDIVGKAFQIFGAFALKRENAPITASFILLFMMAGWNVWNESTHLQKELQWRRDELKQDSVNRAERERFLLRNFELQRDIIECNRIIDRQRQRLKEQEEKINFNKSQKK